MTTRKTGVTALRAAEAETEQKVKLKTSAVIGAEIADAETAKQAAEQRVAELTSTYRTTLLSGSDAEAEGHERELGAARRQVERQTLLIEALTLQLAEAQERESEAAELARLADLETRRNAMEARLGAAYEGLDAVYARAAREIADFLREWDQVKTEALELDRELAAAGMERGERSREIVGWREPDLWIPPSTTQHEEWVVPDGRGGWQPPTMYFLNERNERIPQDPSAVKRTIKKENPGHTHSGTRHRPLFDDSNLAKVNLPAPRSGEAAIWTAKVRG